MKKRTLQQEISSAVLIAIGRSPILSGNIKAGCYCQPCAVNRAIRRVFARHAKKRKGAKP